MKKRFLVGAIAASMILGVPGSFIILPPTVEAEETYSEMNTDISMTFDSITDSTRTYSFKAPENGYGYLSLKNSDSFSYDTARAVIKDDTGLSMTLSSTTNGSTYKFAITKDHVYNVQVESVSAYKRTFVLNFSFTESEQWEKENNNSIENATVIQPDVEYYGSLYGNGDDVDFYRVDLEQDSTVTFSAGPKYEDGTIDPWNLYLVNTDSKSLTLRNIESTTENYTEILKKGTYYLRAYKVGNTSVRPYKISYKIENLVIKKPTVKKVKGNRYKLSGKTYNYIDSVSLKNAGSVTGYRVTIAKKKNMKKKVYTADFAYSKPLKINTYNVNGSKTLYMTVRPYVTDAFGNTIWGKTSSAKKISLGLK